MPASDASPPLHIPLSLGSEFVVELSGLNLRIKCVFVGMDTGRFIVAKLSPNDLIGVFRSDTVTKSPIKVTYQHKDVIYAYGGEILNVVSNPTKLMFISYPEKVEELKVNPQTRLECALPSVVMLANDFVDMVIADISADGCQGVIKPPGAGAQTLSALIQVNKAMDIRTQFPGGNETFSFTAKVRNVSNDVDKISIGMVYAEMPQEAKGKLLGYIARLGEQKKKGQ